MHLRRESSPPLHNSLVVVDDPVNILLEQGLASLLRCGDPVLQRQFLLFFGPSSLSYLFVVGSYAIQSLLLHFCTAFFGCRDFLFELDQFTVPVRGSALADHLHELLVVGDDALALLEEQQVTALVSS